MVVEVTGWWLSRLLAGGCRGYWLVVVEVTGWWLVVEVVTDVDCKSRDETS